MIEIEQNGKKGKEMIIEIGKEEGIEIVQAIMIEEELQEDQFRDRDQDQDRDPDRDHSHIQE